MKQHPYCYPGTKVYRNKLDIRDEDLLELAERVLSASRAELIPHNLSITPDSYREIHRYTLQDVYDWAGQYRTVNTGRTGPFCKADYIAPELDKRFAIINAENNLRGLDPDTFAARAAEHVGELNAIHPFLDGNGRTLRTFLEILGAQAGHEIDLTCIEPEAWNRASAISFHKNDNSLLRAAIEGAMPRRDREQERTPTAAPIEDRPELRATFPDSRRETDLIVVAEELHAQRRSGVAEPGPEQAMQAVINIEKSLSKGEVIRGADLQTLPSELLRNIELNGDDALLRIYPGRDFPEQISTMTPEQIKEERRDRFEEAARVDMSFEEGPPIRASVDEVANTALMVADHASGMTLSLVDFVLGMAAPLPPTGPLAEIQAQHRQEAALERIQESMERGENLRPSDVRLLQPTVLENIKSRGDDYMRELISDIQQESTRRHERDNEL